MILSENEYFVLIWDWEIQNHGENLPESFYFKVLNTGKNFYFRFRRP